MMDLPRLALGTDAQIYWIPLTAEHEAAFKGIGEMFEGKLPSSEYLIDANRLNSAIQASALASPKSIAEEVQHTYGR